MFGDIGKMMKLAAQMKTKLPELQEKLVASEYSAGAGGGVVWATVNGKMVVTDVKIDQQVFTDGDPEMLADLVKAAISTAQTQAIEAAKEAMAEFTGGVQLPGLEGLMG